MSEQPPSQEQCQHQLAVELKKRKTLVDALKEMAKSVVLHPAVLDALAKEGE